MRSRKAAVALTPLLVSVVALAGASLVPRVLRACGPFFALEVLQTRGSSVLKLPPPPFVAEGLAPKPGDRLPVEEGYDQEGVRQRAERQGLPADAVERLDAMRACVDADDAYAAGGESMPEAVRAYTAGAVGYQRRQLDKAQRYFARVLALNPGEGGREQRAVWASFMLGRVASLQADPALAATHFATTRGLVRSGLADPLGLAVASLGEEAKLYLHPGTIAKAVALYARQAAYRSASGVGSLLEVARLLLKDPALLDEGIADATTRRLVLQCLYARGGGSAGDEDGDSLQRVLDAFERHRVTNAEGADLLAASAYAAGRFEIATRLVAYQQTPLSAWITGKLALRRGDRPAALAAFAEATRGLPPHRAARGQALADIGILRVSSGEYAQAMDLFYSAVEDGWSGGRSSTDYWSDLAYLAERVLTIDELLPVVDRLAPPPPLAASNAAPNAAVPDDAHQHQTPANGLRLLTARRLMRAGRYREASRYFDSDAHLRQLAEDYMNAMTTASSRWRTAGTRAEAWFTAAAIARHDGLELLGFELAPDYAVYFGQFGLDGGDPDRVSHDDPSAESGGERSGEPIVAAAAAITAETPDERTRVTASKPTVPVRFHYRLVAVDEALASADLVPRRSQAFAAILCQATGWIIDREPERAATVYARYVREGPLVPWADHFGHDCPAPDFPAADHRRWHERLAMATWMFHHHPRRSLATGATLVACAAVWIVWHRRRRSSVPRRAE